LRYLYPLLCLCLILGSHADCALSGPFSSQREKGKENQQDVIFLKKIHFFFILISEFQKKQIFLDNGGHFDFDTGRQKYLRQDFFKVCICGERG